MDLREGLRSKIRKAFVNAKKKKKVETSLFSLLTIIQLTLTAVLMDLPRPPNQTQG